MARIIRFAFLILFIWIGAVSIQDINATKNAIRERDKILLTNQQIKNANISLWKDRLSCPAIAIWPTIGSRCKIYINEVDKQWCDSWVQCLKARTVFDDYRINNKYIFVSSVIWWLWIIVSFFIKKK